MKTSFVLVRSKILVARCSSIILVLVLHLTWHSFRRQIHMNRSKPWYLLLVVGFVMFAFTSNGQNKTVAQVKLVLEVGNANELSKFLNDKVDLNINGKEGTYSHSQAEGVLKNYFKENPPKSFQINHEGASENGLIYAIGEYKTADNSFRVWLRLKKVNDQFKIHEMSFVEE